MAVCRLPLATLTSIDGTPSVQGQLGLSAQPRRQFRRSIHRCTAEVRAGRVRAAQVSVSQVSVSQVRTAQVRVEQVRIAQIYAVETE